MTCSSSGGCASRLLGAIPAKSFWIEPTMWTRRWLARSCSLSSSCSAEVLPQLGVLRLAELDDRGEQLGHAPKCAAHREA